MNGRPLTDRLLAETLGVFMLCFVVTLAIANLSSASGGLVGIALAYGLSVLVMTAALGHVSGAHFNPAVTVALLLGKNISPVDAAAYIVAQLLGGVLAALVIAGLMPGDLVSVGTPALAPDVSMVQGMFLETIVTFFVVLTVLATLVDRRAPAGVYPMAIGLSLTAGVLALGPLTGAALNPARWFGPAVVSGAAWDMLVWPVWILGPIIGGIAAWAVHDLFSRPVAEPVPVVEPAPDRV